MIPATIRPRQNFLNFLFLYGLGRDVFFELPRRPVAISTQLAPLSILVWQNSSYRIKEVKNGLKQKSTLASFTMSGYIKSLVEAIDGTAIAK